MTIRRQIGALANRALNPFGYQFQRVRSYPDSTPDAGAFSGLLKLRESNNDFLAFCAERYRKSRAQLFQDLFALWATNEKRGGFFVEFGATNGLDISNTYLLESEYAWRGILAEPAQRWHQDLCQNRKCAIDNRCVWSKSEERVEFNETKEAEFSTINMLSSHDFHAERRQNGKQYHVTTVSLHDLLGTHNAPTDI
jgi:hypothetical protein